MVDVEISDLPAAQNLNDADMFVLLQNNVAKSITGAILSAFINAVIPTAPEPSDSTPIMDGSAAAGTSSSYARADHVHPKDTSKQDLLTFDDLPTSNSNNPVKSRGIYAAIEDAVEQSLESPHFTGEPTAPTPSYGVAGSTRIATTAYVLDCISRKLGLRVLTPTLTWNAAHTEAEGTLELSRTEIEALLAAGTLVCIYAGDESRRSVLMFPSASSDFLYYSCFDESGFLHYTAEIDDDQISITISRRNSVPAGGTVGQVLTKSAFGVGYEWADLPTYNGGVSDDE